jgi:hypothetical protein
MLQMLFASGCLPIRYISLASVLLLVLCGVSQGQDTAELTIIRSLLGEPQSTRVTTATTTAAPRDSPLKIYLNVTGDTVDRDKKVNDEFVEWLGEWGRANSDKLTLEITSEPGDARVALIHFTDFPTEIVDPGGGDRDTPPQQSSISSSSSTVRMSMTVHTYVVIKDPKVLTIVYRRKVQLLTRSAIVPGAHLSSTVTNKLRKDITNEIQKQTLKTGDQKNTKRPDYKLREEFAKWLISGGSSRKSY